MGSFVLLRMPAARSLQESPMREIRTSGSTRGEWVTLNVSPSLLLYRCCCFAGAAGGLEKCPVSEIRVDVSRYPDFIGASSAGLEFLVHHVLQLFGGHGIRVS